ncbi:GlxA family transcriptional regulator [Nocardioides acrostichi]|uniref:Helix-turn-helix domain-containing protein n=1 Tax=Nocardioides acrostichi TaxID=2784339 RepID=A0A930YCY7_9ACTN|nr:helix-turn-helix domain-containing protein [Nocardioides acrostichi]MBF4161919.1 helix-turn-helix domain-containing protein [Nocardioides acrostichi]
MQSVAVIVQDGAEPFGLGALVEVWGEPCHPGEDLPTFDFRVCTPRPGRVRGRSAFDLHVDLGLDAAADADLVCISPTYDFLEHDPAVMELIRSTHDRGAYLFAHCTASFELAEAGILDGREATTHWRHTAKMAHLYPHVLVRPDVLYVHDGTVLTGAGSAAALDASLHLMRDEFGARAAAGTARRIVIPPHRDGGQAQFVARPIPDCEAETLGPVLAWAVEHLADDLGVEVLARQALMSPRTFARRFRDETGTTPHAWVTRQRVAAAEELLEQTDQPVEWIARRVGFGHAATLRQHFARERGVSPQAYRRQFSCVEDAG